MFIVTVIPIGRGIPLQELSYFTAKEVLPGALVLIPIRKRTIFALVLALEPVVNARSTIRNLGYQLKKLESIEAQGFFSPLFIDAVRSTANHHACSMGALIQSVFPQTILEHPETNVVPQLTTPPVPQTRGVISAFQAPIEDRIPAYRSIIEEELALGHSVYLCAPTLVSIDRLSQSLAHGTAKTIIILHGQLSKTTLQKRWTQAISSPHPVLVIGTAYYLSIPLSNIGTIILEQEGASSYKTLARPFVDLRVFAEYFARASGARLLLCDTLLRPETFYRAEMGEIAYFARPRHILQRDTRVKVIDMRPESTSTDITKASPGAILSRASHTLAQKAVDSGSNIFFLAPRRGHAPMTLCSDCETVVSCSECKGAVTLYRKTTQQTGSHVRRSDEPEALNVFLCHRCGTRREAEYSCANCHSWRLKPYGIGVGVVIDELHKSFPDRVIFRMDSDTIKSHKDAVLLARQYNTTPGAILVGTEMAIPYIETTTHAVIVSVRGMLSLPDFRMSERVFRILLELREKTQQYLVIQSREPGEPLFDYIADGSIVTWLRAELEARKILAYPPYSVLIKLTHEGKREDGISAMQSITEHITPYHPVIFPAFTTRVKQLFRTHALLRLTPSSWPNTELLTLLRQLPPSIIIKVDPETLL